MIVVFGKQKEKNNNRRMYTLYLYLSSNQIVPFPVAYLSQIIAKLTSTISGRKKQKRLDNDVLLNRQIRKKKYLIIFVHIDIIIIKKIPNGKISLFFV